MPRMSCNKEERNRSESGSVLMLTIIALVFLLGLGLLTIDAGRLYLMRHRADSIAKLAGKLAYMGRRGVCRAVDDPGNPSNHIADQQTNLLVQENVRLSSFLGIQPPVVQINYPDPTTRYEQEVQVGLAYQPTILRYLGLSSGYTIQVSAHKKSEIKPQAAILVSDNSNSMGSRISGPTSPVKLDMAKASLIAYLQTGLWALDQLAVIFSANFGDNVFPSSASSAQTFQGEVITPPLSCLNLELVRTDVINIVRGASTQATSATNISDVFR